MIFSDAPNAFADCTARDRIRRGIQGLTPQQVRALCGTAVVRPRVAQVCAPKRLCLVSRQDTASLQRFLQKRARRITMGAHLTDVLRIVIACIRYHRVTRMPAAQVVAMLRDPERTRMQDADTQAWGPDKLEGVSAATAKRQLAALVDAGKLVRVGRYLTTPRIANVDAERDDVAAEARDAACHRRRRRAMAERARRRRVAPVGSLVSQEGPRICSTPDRTPPCEGHPSEWILSPKALPTPGPASSPGPVLDNAVPHQAPWPHGAAGSPCRPPCPPAAHSSDPDPAPKSIAAGATDGPAADAGCMPDDIPPGGMPHVRTAMAAALDAVLPQDGPYGQARLNALKASIVPACEARADAADAQAQAPVPAVPQGPPGGRQAPPPACPPGTRPAAAPPSMPGGWRPCDTRVAATLLADRNLTLSPPELKMVLRTGATYDQLRRAVDAYRAWVTGRAAPANGPAPYLRDTCDALRKADLQAKGRP